MLDTSKFFSCLTENGVEFFTGVPDSLLKYFCAYLIENVSHENNIVAANEGNAIGIAAGYHLSTGNIPMVYMQNAGLGNALNPLMSLVAKEVYNIPILLLIGWRGKPGTEAACQHIKQGEITIDLLDTMEIPYFILPEDISEAENLIEDTINDMYNDNLTRAIIVPRYTFSEYSLKEIESKRCEMKREEAIEIIIKSLQTDDVVVSSTGKISREVYEVRERFEESHENDFLMVGSMGHASQIALGIASRDEDKQVVCIEGDGSLIMHMGGLSTITWQDTKNLKHIILNNCAYDSAGGQPTAAPLLDFLKISEGAGYSKAIRAETAKELKEKLEELFNSEGPAMLEVVVEKGARDDLGRPDIGAIERKKQFMDFLQD